MKTLYVSDLDGTLLSPEKRITPRTASIINGLIDKGLLFSVNTARSLMGAELLNLRDIRFTTPLILMNGALLYDLENRQVVDACEMDGKTVASVLDLCHEGGKEPLLYRVEGNSVGVSFTVPTNPLEWEFIKERGGQFPDLVRQVEAYDRTRPAIYFSTQDTYDRLKRIADRLEALPGVDYVLYEDNYHENNWYLEVSSDRGGKDKGMLRLKELMGAERTVAFGDNFNDLSMLKAADVALVVENGQPAMKEEADLVIGPNSRDGVAEYLLRHAQL